MSNAYWAKSFGPFRVYHYGSDKVKIYGIDRYSSGKWYLDLGKFRIQLKKPRQ